MTTIDPDDLALVESEGTGPAVGYAISLLLSIADVEGTGDLADVCEGVAALLQSTRPRSEAVRPADLFYLAGAALQAALDTGAAAADCYVSVGDGGGWTSAVRTSHLAPALKAAAKSGLIR